MTLENTSQSADLNDETRTTWNHNAPFWDDKMGEGNDFHRPLHTLFNACFRAGLVIDGLEEPAFNSPEDGSKSKRMLNCVHYKEIPPALVVRLRVPR